jgi:hypothetical protein
LAFPYNHYLHCTGGGIKRDDVLGCTFAVGFIGCLNGISVNAVVDMVEKSISVKS